MLLLKTTKAVIVKTLDQNKHGNVEEGKKGGYSILIIKPFKLNIKSD